MVFKKFRKMKVYEASGYNYKKTPSIILKGVMALPELLPPKRKR